ncbi:MAG: GDP-mannose 4,6-dehydratase [Bacteroidetes bacterium]|nr:GDP-mannose 4,6-dehydratase [Bacteroidota bacterium]
MRLLITGGAGFIGSHIAEEALKAGHEVTIYDNLFSGKLDNVAHLKEQVTFIKGDIIRLGFSRSYPFVADLRIGIYGDQVKISPGV